MSTRPWYPFYPSDYLADTRLLSLEAHGLYMLLLHHHWIRGSLPTSERLLAKLIGEDVRKFRRCFAEVSDKFKEHNGELVNPRMVLERDKALEKQGKASYAARKRWDADAYADGMPPQPQPQLKPETIYTQPPMVPIKTWPEQLAGLQEPFEQWRAVRLQKHLDGLDDIQAEAIKAKLIRMGKTNARLAIEAATEGGWKNIRDISRDGQQYGNGKSHEVKPGTPEWRARSVEYLDPIRDAHDAYERGEIDNDEYNRIAAESMGNV